MLSYSFLFYILSLGYSPPQRNQVSRQLGVLYKHHYNLLKNELKQVYALSVTLDFWSNRRCQSFLCITGHWIIDGWESISKIIDFSCYNIRHTAIEIAITLKEKFIALDIFEKIVCITCDGAENMKLACQYLNNNIPRLWCCAHRLHLVVVNGLGFWIPKEKMNDATDQSSSTDASTNNRIIGAGTNDHTTHVKDVRPEAIGSSDVSRAFPRNSRNAREIHRKSEAVFPPEIHGKFSVTFLPYPLGNVVESCRENPRNSGSETAR